MWEYNSPRSSEELYHFGVLGMKWGVRKSDEERLDAYKKRESGEVRRIASERIAKIKKKDDRLAEKHTRRAQKLTDEQYPDDKKLRKIEQKSYAQRAKAKAVADQMLFELSGLGRYTLKDVSREKIRVGSALAAGAITTIGSAALLFTGTSNFAVGFVPNTERMKTKLRIAKLNEGIIPRP
jgi:hypothetical protein